MLDYLFEESLISDEVQNVLPLNYIIRPLAKEDYDKGVLDCLGQLSIVEEVSEAKFSKHFIAMKNSGHYYTVVIEDKDSNRVVGLGTLLVELKFLRGCAKAGLIEDIVVDDSHRGKKFGLMIIDQLKYIGKKLGCYKIILNCNQKNIGFYEKCGFIVKDVQMTLGNYAPPKENIATKSLKDVFKLVREPKLPPNQVAFRIPPKVNKLDIRDYLWNIYKVPIIDVRTMNYATKPGRNLPGRGRLHYKAKYKKAIVTLRADFKYPPPVDNLEHSSQAERIERTAMMFRRLAGWKSRPKRLETMYMDRYTKLNEQMKKAEAQKLKDTAEGKPHSTGQN